MSFSTLAGVVVQAEVSGPGGFTQTSSGSQSQSNFTPSTYTLTAEPVRKAGTPVDEVYVGNSGTVVVNPGPAANFDVNHTLRAGSGKLWVRGTSPGWQQPTWPRAEAPPWPLPLRM